MAHVLIVDDEPGIRITLGRFLEREGHTVQGAESVNRARERMAQEPYDVVLSDIIMPDGTGLDLLAHIQEAYPSTLVIIFTGGPSLDTATEALRLGAFDYLAKPLKKDEACGAVGRAARVKALRDKDERLNEENRLHSMELEPLVEERTAKLRSITEQREAAYLRTRGVLLRPSAPWPSR